MKTVFVSDVQNSSYIGKEVSIPGWVKSVRRHKKTVFVDLSDSSGFIQVVFDKSIHTTETLNTLEILTEESAIEIFGIITLNQDHFEIQATKFRLVNLATKILTPSVRSDNIDIFDEALANHLLTNRYIYIRNPKIMEILKFRSQIMNSIRLWFDNNNFTELTAPIITNLPLYDDKSAVNFELHNENLFLTQCVGFYLESSVMGLERIYNIGPSFRREESRSKRHLIEYWHIKAEFAWGNFEDVILLVESLLHDNAIYIRENCSQIANVLNSKLCLDGMNTPFPRITYREAIKELERGGFDHPFGKSLGSEEEKFLSKNFLTPFWIAGIPRSIEPFPYVINPDDHEVTLTADLIANNGYGELLGVAEKISDPIMLDERMEEKNRLTDPRYEWLRDLRRFGAAPHFGFGMGVERYLRWVLGIPNVRDCIPFPRSFGRRIFP